MRRRVNGRRRMMRPGRIKRRRRRTRFGNEAGRKMRPIIRMIMIRRGRRRRPLRASLFFDLSICLRHSPYLSRSHFLSLSLFIFHSLGSFCVLSLLSLYLSLLCSGPLCLWAMVPTILGLWACRPLGFWASFWHLCLLGLWALSLWLLLPWTLSLWASDLWTFRSLGLCAPKLPGSPAWAIWDRILVRSHQLYGQSRPKTVPRRPARRPETP